MRSLLALLILSGLLTACERREEPDPFAVPGAMKLSFEYLTPREAEERLMATAAGRALPQTTDPCGIQDGPTGMSGAWVRAQLVEAGHAADWFCPQVRDAAAWRRAPDDETVSIDEISRRSALLRQQMALTDQAGQAAIVALREADRPAPAA